MIKNLSEEDIAKIAKKNGIVSKPSTPVPEPSTPKDESFEEEKEEAAIVNYLSTPQSQEYKPLDFEDPVEFLFWLDEDLASGRRQLWDWQVETLLFIWRDVYDIEERLKFCLTAANGSGKDAYIIAPLAATQIVSKVRSRFIATSKSTHQLNTQTNCYIKQLCQKTGTKLRAQGYHQRPFMYHSKPFHIACAFTGAEILSFVTDEAENVEGYHPWPDAPSAWITIAINEAKGVPDEFFDGFSRCTYTRWLEITSPGIKTGRNFEHYDKSLKHPEKYEKGSFYSRRITSYQCPHKSQKAIEEDAEDYGGKDSPLFRSKHLAEYTDVGESVIIGLDVIDKWVKTPPAWDKDNFMAAGLDLSLGGDETVLITRRGNEVIAIDGTRMRDSNLLESYLDKLMVNRGLTHKDPIFTDVGGLGKPIAQGLMKMGWKIIHVLNNNPAIGMDKHIYQNRGTEIYFEVCNYYARGYIKPLSDKLWREQMGSRKYIRLDSDKVKLQPKRQIIADKDKGALASATEWTSPDRADAFVLAFMEFEPRELKRKHIENPNRMKRITQAELINHMSEHRFNGYRIPTEIDVRRKASGNREWLRKELGYL